MNDYGEGEFFLKILLNELDNANSEFIRKRLIEEDGLNIIKNRILSEAEDRYIICMSKNSDTLSQWRGYADDGRGVSIGFDMSELGFSYINDKPVNQISNHFDKLINLSEINYCDEERAKIICKAYVETLESQLLIQKNKEGNEILTAINLISSALFSTKHYSFQEENEIRLMCNPNYIFENEVFKPVNNSRHLNDMKFKTRDSFLTPYFELDFSSIKNRFIKEITLGPKNKFHERDLKLFLDANGLGNIEIKRSVSTYR